MAVEELVGPAPTGWEYATLSDVCQRGGGDIQTGPFGSQLHAADYVPVGVPSIMPQNIGDNRIVENGIARIRPEDAKRLSRYLIRSGDIVYSRRGDVERRALVRQHEDGWLCGTGCLRVRLGEHGPDPLFTTYYLGHPSVREWIVRHAHGATMPNLNTSILGACPVLVPPPSEQRAIAHILGGLDDKIELNRRMSETLEAMARALFKSWFVDFDPVRAKAEGRDPGVPKPIADLFPDRLVDSELGEIPEGWEVKPVGDHMVNFDSKRIPVSGADRSKRQGPYPYHGAAGVMDSVDDYLFDGIHLLVGEDGSVVRNDGLAVTQYVWGRIWVNNHAHVLQGRGAVSTEQLYLYFHYEPVAPYVTGAVQPKLSQGRLNTMPFVFAGEGVCRAFERTIHPWFARLRASVDETKTLAAVRDALLPKLISGALRVKNAERIIEVTV